MAKLISQEMTPADRSARTAAAAIATTVATQLSDPNRQEADSI